MTININLYIVRIITFLILYLYVQSSVQTFLEFRGEEGLTVDEIELIKNYRSLRYRRQTHIPSVIYDASGTKQSADCGINSRSARKKRDGEHQGDYDWPWMVALLHKGTHLQFCGGALLNHQYVLTAAHCLKEPGKEKTKDEVIVRLGEWNLYDPLETKHLDVYISEMKVHDDYDPATKNNDIALLKLDRSVEYTQYIRPICLPSVELKYNETSIVSGWGKVHYEKNPSNILLDVDVKILEHAECVDQHANGNLISADLNICAGGEGKDSCEGDSGGPLMYQENGKRWVVIGIVSWGKFCGEYPGVYTNVKYFLPWIDKRILDASP